MPSDPGGQRRLSPTAAGQHCSGQRGVAVTVAVIAQLGRTKYHIGTGRSEFKDLEASAGLEPAVEVLQTASVRGSSFGLPSRLPSKVPSAGENMIAKVADSNSQIWLGR